MPSTGTAWTSRVMLSVGDEGKLNASTECILPINLQFIVCKSIVSVRTWGL